MWKAVRAAIAGVVIGLVCGTIYVGVKAVRVMYNVTSKMEESIGDINENAEDILSDSSVESEETMVNGSLIASEDMKTFVSEDSDLGMYDFSQLENLLDEIYGEDGANGEALSDVTDAISQTEVTLVQREDVIRISVEYTGDEALTDTEKSQLEQYVETAVLYGLAEKLGDDYATLDISTVRNKLIMSLEYINACAEESAEEWGIFAEAKSTFDYIYMPSASMNDASYPAGYYETLCVTLS